MTRDVARQRLREGGGSTAGFVRLVAHTDPVALVGITLSITLSIVLDLSNAASGVESLLAGLMGITISLLVDSLARAERRFHLRTLLDGPPWLVRTTTELAGAIREAAEQHAGTRVAVEAQRRYEQFRLEAEQLADGRIIRRGDEDEDLVGATRACVRRLDGLTNVMPRVSGELSWWRSEIGRRYWEANVEALQRGVQITRVFVYATLTDDLSALVEKQRAAGARVGLLPLGVVSPHLHVNLTLWDGSSCWEAHMTAHGEIGENQFSVNRTDVARLTRVFDLCANAATFHD
ncbi:hypothetical protein ACLQ3H_15380 [Micromonospora saelicesensis]|uniref:SMODS and SLOG-associating 2TM effector domain-containing protein n=1 Tax=Micromonospora saelicesensis TaxID=285676 RepID=A0ABX9CMW2_9ACTN|nr:hypothetical protein [Micromonospora saelicesensis]RAO02069.1 hypothetical protein GAR05_01678 [Micromonospora saelicesensis]RAO51022.1 hypothetical protein PSN01_04361 [Micromonospora saelicesensis]RAO56989.1 hypothetical protein LUPAC06_03176 [Micromonospora saelicesensis]